MSTPQESRRRLYVEVSKNLDAMGQRVLELMRHPDASPEDLTVAHRAYADAYNRWATVKFKLQQKYPDRGLPWNYK